MKTIEDNLRELWDNAKNTNIQILSIVEEEEKKKGFQKIFKETIVKTFPNMGKEILT